LGLTESYSTFIVPLDVRMKGLKFTKETSTIALIFFTVYFVYGLFYTPTLQYVVSLGVGGLAYGMTESYEIAVIALLVINYVFPMFRGSSMKGVTAYRIEGEGFVGANAEEVSKRISSMSGIAGGFKVAGVGSKTSEGFADAGDEDLTLSETKGKKEPEDVTAKSKPASVEVPEDKAAQLEKMTEMMATVMKTMNKGTAGVAAPKKEDAFEDKSDKKLTEKLPVVSQPAESFADKSGLFKLGQIPAEAKGGFHIDAGTTVMNAINSLKPDQIKAMTSDTKQLIDTQKSLMSMLQTFQPMVQEGKQMMDTFQTMFSPTAGALPATGPA
jgi:hypothetical protein